MILDLVMLFVGIVFLLFFTVGTILFVGMLAAHDLVKAAIKSLERDLRHIRALENYEGSEPI